MFYFFTVAAPARSGTMWFSRTLTTEQSFCYHELSTHLLPYPSIMAMDEWMQAQVADSDFELAQRQIILRGFPQYFSRLWERSIYGQYIVGNSDHFMLDYLPGLWLLWPQMKFIFSVRNGINCVQSGYVHEPFIEKGVLAQWHGRWQTADFFEVCCNNWCEEIAQWQRSKAWLATKAQCFETRFEKVTTDIQELKKMWNWVGIGKWEEYTERNGRLMQTPINARTNREHVNSPEDIWRTWSRFQRNAFRKICGDTMAQLSYSLPE